MRAPSAEKPAIGILLLDGPRTKHNAEFPGLMTSDNTFPFAVRREVVRGAFPKCCQAMDTSLIPSFIEAARKLEREGVKAITGACGLMAFFRQEISSAVSVPVFPSTLMLVPLVHQMLPPHRKVGILTLDSKRLTEKHFQGAGWSSSEVPVVVVGADQFPFWNVVENTGDWDFDKMGIDLTKLAESATQRDPDIGAFVMECVLMPLHAPAIRRATGLPVFGISDFTRFVYGAIVAPP